MRWMMEEETTTGGFRLSMKWAGRDSDATSERSLNTGRLNEKEQQFPEKPLKVT